MKKFIIKLKKILWEDSFDNVELFGSVNALVWGVWFVTHPDLFSIGPAYKYLASVASVQTWGWIFISVGILKLIGVLSDRYVVRKWFALVASCLWTFVSITLFQGSPSSILVVVVGEVLLYSIWEFFRHSRRHTIRQEIREEIKKGTLK